MKFLTTKEDLDAQPVKTIVVDRDGDAWQKQNSGAWVGTSGGRGYHPLDFTPLRLVVIPA